MNRFLAILFAVVLVGALVLLVPLRTALGWIGAERLGLTAAQVEGTMWAGHLSQARYGGVSLGEVAVALDPVALLTGRRRLTLTAEGGAVNGRAVLVSGADGAGLAEASGVAPLSVAPAGLALRGAVTVENLTAVFRAGRCIMASGQLTTDLFQRNAALLGDAGAPLSGEAACQGGVLVAPLRGTSASGAVSMTLRIRGDGRYDLDTGVTTTDPALDSRLALAGFILEGGTRRRTDRGTFWR